MEASVIEDLLSEFQIWYDLDLKTKQKYQALFTGSLRSGKRAAAIMSLIQSARMNGHDPYAYLKALLKPLPIQRVPT